MVGGGGRQGAVGWWSCGSSGSPRLLPAAHSLRWILIRVDVRLSVGGCGGTCRVCRG